MGRSDDIRNLERDWARGRLNRRDFIRRATALGLSTSAIAGIVAQTRGGSAPALNAATSARAPSGGASAGEVATAPAVAAAPTSAPPPLARGGEAARGEGAISREALGGTLAMQQAAVLAGATPQERLEMQKVFGLEPALSINDKSLTLFRRDPWGLGNVGTFTGVPFLYDANQLGNQNVVIVGEPLDTGTTYRSGTRFGPDAIRQISTLGGQFNVERGLDLGRGFGALKMVDIGNIQMIPANIEKSFDQIAKAIDFITERGVFPVILGGDHSIGYPNIRGMAPLIGGKIGIIHFDRHSDMSPSIWDERMHGTPFFHATDIANAPATNLVQIGIGGWTGSPGGMQVARDRKATVITTEDLDRYGIDRVIETALEVAWKGAKTVYLSFDIDVMDPAYAPGTGTPEPGGLTSREALKMVRQVAREGLAGMEVVEVSPPYDHADITSLLAGRLIMDVLGTLMQAGKLGRLPAPVAEGPGVPKVARWDGQAGW